jgi:hypothetical protein
VPTRFVFPIRYFPVQDFPLATAVTPEAEGDQQHHLLAPSLMTLALAFVQLDRLRLGLHPQPNAIELHHRGHIGDGIAVGLVQYGLNLIDPLIERP